MIDEKPTWVRYRRPILDGNPYPRKTHCQCGSKMTYDDHGVATCAKCGLPKEPQKPQLIDPFSEEAKRY